MSDFTLPDYAPTYPISKSVKPRQRTVKLPDWGTEQRATVGQNQTSPEWTIKWILRPAHADILDEFLAERARRGEWFLWTPPGGTLGRYRCDSWSKLVSSSAVREVQATFRQVYSYERPVELIAALQAGTFIASFGEVYSFYAPLVSEDPYAEHVSLLLHMDGTNASTTFTDSSYNKLAAVPDGSAQISTTQNKFGGASGVFNGTNSSLTIAPSSAFAFGTGDFTVELWAYQSATPNGGALISEQYTGTGDSVALAIGFCDGGVGNATGSRPFLGLFNGTAWIGAVAASALANSQWHHIAAVRFGNAWNLYVNGTSVASFTDNSAVLRDELVYIGRRWNTGGTTSFFNGSIDDVRITKGVARYTANFTAPTAAFVNPTVVPVDPYAENVSLLLHMDGTNGSTTITDSSPTPKTVTANGNAQISTAQSKFGGSSIAFDGNGDWITAPANPAFSFGTGDFTVELFARWNSFANVNVIFDTRNGGASSNGIVFYTTSAGVFTVYRGLTALITGATLQTGQWYHIAVSRAAGTTRLFVDGVQSGSSASDSATYTDQNFFAGKTNEALSNYFNGYIDDLRITKGVARYTANFTPPTAAFPNPIDAYADNVSLLLHMDGTSGGNTFINTSSSALAVTAAGNTQLSTTQKKFGITSAYFDGSGDSLDFPEISLAGDFTIECWIYPVSTADMNVLGGSTSNNQALRINFSGTAGRTIMYSEAFIIDANNAVVANQWQHVAITRSGSNTRLFVDGVQKGTTNTTWTGTFRLQVVGRLKVDGAYYTPSYDYNGYLDELRVTTGVARYTANFTAPTAAFPSPAIDPYAASVSLLLHMDGSNGSTTFTDNSSNALTVTPTGNAQISTAQSKFGGASAVFDGTGDFLTIPTSPLFDLGTTYTIEFWAYQASTSGNGFGLVHRGFYTAATNTWSGLAFSIRGGGTNIRFYFYATINADEQFIDVANALVVNGWKHVAMVRNGTTGYVFIDGVQSGTITGLNTPAASTQSLRIGRWDFSAGNEDFNGYIDDLRITKGVARYVSNFTPPAAQHPLPSVTVTDPYRANTSLLLHMNGANNSTAFVDNSINGLTITPAGNAKISTAQSKFGSASGLFDGTGDYISMPYSSIFAFGSNNFTIECWLYRTGVNTANASRIWSAGGDFYHQVDISIDFNGNIASYGTTTGTSWNAWAAASITFIPLNTWQHIALVRNGGTVTMYVNGTGTVLTSSLSTTALATGTSGASVRTIGGQPGVDRAYFGYIDELRITKGVARYTANFTPPTAAFPDA